MSPIARWCHVRFLTAAAVVLGPLAAARAQEAPSSGVDTRYVTSMTVAYAQLRPAQLLTSPAAQLLPVEVAEAAGLKYLGIKPSEIRLVTLVAETPAGVSLPNYAAIVELDKPFNPASFAPAIIQHTAKAQLLGRTYLQNTSGNPVLPSFFPVNGRTLMIGSEAMVQKLLKQDRLQARGRFVDDLKATAAKDHFFLSIDLEALRPFLQIGIGAAKQEAPAELSELFDLPLLLRGASLSVNLSTEGQYRLALQANDADAARKIHGLFTRGIATAESKYMREIQPFLASEDLLMRAGGEYLSRVLKLFTDLAESAADGEMVSMENVERLSVQARGETLTIVGSDGSLSADGSEGESNTSLLKAASRLGFLAAVLVPATQRARRAARYAQLSNNLRLMIVGMHIYQDRAGYFPPRVFSANSGKPVLSWRVYMLRMASIDDDLFDEFHLDEPWDSPHNKMLIPKMPSFFYRPSAKWSQRDGRACFAMPIGEGFLANDASGQSIKAVTDGEADTIAIVEVDDAHAPIWTKPDDWTPDAQFTTTGLGGGKPGKFLAVFVDGHIQELPLDIDPQSLQAMLTINGGEPVNVP